MDYASFVEIGYIQRTHGIKGELQISLNSSKVNPENLESVFVEIDGIPIPFFIETLKSKSEDKAIVKFDDVDSLEAGEELVGFKLLLSSDEVEQNDELELSDLVGYQLIDAEDNPIGEIKFYEEFGLNSVFTVILNSGKETLIPAVTDLVIEVDVEDKKVWMEIPAGLLNL